MDIRKIWDLPRAQKARMLAAILSAHVDPAGRFLDTPKRILQGALLLQQPQLRYNDHERLAIRIVELLRTESWIVNKDTVSGRAGGWYLNVERLGGLNDAIRRAQAVVVADDLRRSYDGHMIALIIAALQLGKL